MAQLLFKSGDYFVQRFWRCGDYLRVATNQEQRLIERIRYLFFSSALVGLRPKLSSLKSFGTGGKVALYQAFKHSFLLLFIYCVLNSCPTKCDIKTSWSWSMWECAMDNCWRYFRKTSWNTVPWRFRWCRVSSSMKMDYNLCERWKMYDTYAGVYTVVYEV